MRTNLDRPSTDPAWTTWVGTLTILLGLYLAAAYAVEATKQYVLRSSTGAEFATLWECPADELAEEDVSELTCEQMAGRVAAFIDARPDWFRSFNLGVGIAGSLFALISIFVAMGVMDRRPWARPALTGVMAALALLDLAVFTASANAPPIIRDEYLWNSLLWFLIHTGLIAALVAGKQEDAHA